jgi:hypothetical protein
MQYKDNSEMDDGELLHGLEAVASFLRVSERHVSELARDAGLPLRQIGLMKIATKRQLLEWLEGLPLRGGR